MATAVHVASGHQANHHVPWPVSCCPCCEPLRAVLSRLVDSLVVKVPAAESSISSWGQRGRQGAGNASSAIQDHNVGHVQELDAQIGPVPDHWATLKHCPIPKAVPVGIFGSKDVFYCRARRVQPIRSFVRLASQTCDTTRECCSPRNGEIHGDLHGDRARGDVEGRPSLPVGRPTARHHHPGNPVPAALLTVSPVTGGMRRNKRILKGNGRVGIVCWLRVLSASAGGAVQTA